MLHREAEEGPRNPTLEAVCLVAVCLVAVSLVAVSLVSVCSEESRERKQEAAAASRSRYIMTQQHSLTVLLIFSTTKAK